jgi:hypothetical protein
MSFCINGCKNRVLTAINYYPCNGASRQIDFIVLPFPELNFLNPKSQNSNLKQISKYNESNSKRVWIIGDWNFGIICYLVLGIFSIQGLNYTYISNTTSLTYLWDMTLGVSYAQDQS